MTDMMDYRKYIDKGEREVLKKMPLMLTVYLAEKGRFFPVLISDILCRFLNDTEDNIIVNFSEDRKSNVHPEDYKKLMLEDWQLLTREARASTGLGCVLLLSPLFPPSKPPIVIL